MTGKCISDKLFSQFLLLHVSPYCRHLLGVKHDLIPARAYWFFSHYCNFKQIKLNHNNCYVRCITAYVINKLMYTLFKNEILIQVCFLVVKLHTSGAQYPKPLWSGSEVGFDLSMKMRMRNLQLYQIENKKKKLGWLLATNFFDSQLEGKRYWFKTSAHFCRILIKHVSCLKTYFFLTLRSVRWINSLDLMLQKHNRI